MDDVNWALWAAALISGGVVGVVFESLTGMLTGWRTRRHERDLQASEHRHLTEDHRADRDHQSALQTQSLRHDREMKALDRRHERLRRRDTNHDDQREHFGQLAADALEWIEYESGREYGPEQGDWYPELSPTPALGSPDDVATALRSIATKHPTKEVRTRARSLHQSLAGHYGSILPGADGYLTTRTAPDLDDWLKWQREAEALVEMIHDPPDDAETDLIERPGLSS